MKVLSFDIGTRTLCFNIMHYDPELNNGRFIINKDEWVTVDIIERARQMKNTEIATHLNHRCNANLKNGKRCSSIRTVLFNKTGQLKNLSNLLKKDLENIEQDINKSINSEKLIERVISKTKKELTTSINELIDKFIDERSQKYYDISSSRRSQQERKDDAENNVIEDIYLCSRHFPKVSFMSYDTIYKKYLSEQRKELKSITDIDMNRALESLLDESPAL